MSALFLIKQAEQEQDSQQSSGRVAPYLVGGGVGALGVGAGAYAFHRNKVNGLNADKEALSKQLTTEQTARKNAEDATEEYRKQLSEANEPVDPAPEEAGKEAKTSIWRRIFRKVKK